MKLLIVLLLITIVVAEELNVEKDNADNEVMARRRHHHRFGHHHHLSHNDDEDEDDDYDFDYSYSDYDEYDEENNEHHDNEHDNHKHDNKIRLPPNYLNGYFSNVWPVNNHRREPLDAIDFVPNRIRGLLYPYHTTPVHFKHYAGAYGLHALWILWAIKIKIVFVAFVVGVAIFYGIKAFAGSKLLASAPVYSEVGPIYHETPYHNSIPFEHSAIEHAHFDHGHSSDIAYSSYPGPPSDVYQSGAPSYGPTGYSSSGDSSPDSGAPVYGADVPTDVTTTDEHFRRVSKQKRAIDEHKEWVEIGFMFLGVKSNSCKKRFICEMDFRSRIIPLAGMMFKFAAENFFSEYRTIEETPLTYNDCGRIHHECEVPAESQNSTGSLSEPSNSLENDESQSPMNSLLRRRRKNQN